MCRFIFRRTCDPKCFRAAARRSPPSRCASRSDTSRHIHYSSIAATLSLPIVSRNRSIVEDICAAHKTLLLVVGVRPGLVQRGQVRIVAVLRRIHHCCGGGCWDRCGDRCGDGLLQCTPCCASIRAVGDRLRRALLRPTVCCQLHSTTRMPCQPLVRLHGGALVRAHVDRPRRRDRNGVRINSAAAHQRHAQRARSATCAWPGNR